VSAVTPDEPGRHWKTSKRAPSVQLYLSTADGDAEELARTTAAGLPVMLSILPTTEWINPDELAGAAAAVIQVDADSYASLKRFQKLAGSVETPLIAACYDPPLSLVRSLLRSGAQDVIPLPLTLEELEAALARLGDVVAERTITVARPSPAKLVTFIKSVGGVGATALLTQLAIRFAEKESSHNRDVCLIDLDVQFGDVAFQLGLQPKFSLVDLFEAGTRLDGELLRATTVQHNSGLNVIGAPTSMMPLEGIAGEHLLEIVETATREFDTVFVDLPTNWTNWSLSLVARSQLVVLVIELTVASLHRARRQLDLLRSQDLGDMEVRVVVNRYDKRLARTVSLADARKALGRDISNTIANDFPLVRAAIDRGIPIHEVKRKTALEHDINSLDSAIAAALHLER
jgi:pilus assembly protein CpaE